MNCSEFEAELEQLVECRSSTLSSDASYHLDQCSNCRQRWNDHRLIESALQSWRRTPKMPSLADSLIIQLRDERLNQAASFTVSLPMSGKRFGKWTAVLAAAACLFLMIGLGAALRFGGNDQGVAQLPNSPSQTPSLRSADPSQIGVASSVVAVLDDLRSEYRELAAETTATARDFAVALPPAPLAAWSDTGLIATTTPAQDTENTVTQESGGTVSVLGRSIGTQISQAMDFLWVAVPESVPRG